MADNKPPAWSDAQHWAGLVDGSRCPICLSGVPNELLVELPAAWVVATRRAVTRGHVILFAKRHVVEPFQLTPSEWAEYWSDVNAVAEAISAGMRPTKLNYEIHGNTIPHLHVNLFPRWIGDQFEGQPIDARRTYARSDAELAELRHFLEPLVSST